MSRRSKRRSMRRLFPANRIKIAYENWAYPVAVCWQIDERGREREEGRGRWGSREGSDASRHSTASEQMQTANSLTAALIHIPIPIPILGNSHKLIQLQAPCTSASMPCPLPCPAPPPWLNFAFKAQGIGSTKYGSMQGAGEQEAGSGGKVFSFQFSVCSFLVNLQLSCQRKCGKWKM